jgi:hypothetical protein
VTARIAVKDQANQCELFGARVTVARDATHGTAAAYPPVAAPAPRAPSEARAAFDSLFKK